VAARIDDLPEHVARSIRTAPIAPAVRTLFARIPRPIVLTAEVAADSAAPLALAQLVKLAAEGGRVELGSVRLAAVGDPPRLSLASGDRVFEARGDAIGSDARGLARRALPTLFDCAELAATADLFASEASKLATIQHVVHAMLGAADVHRAVHAMLTGITSGDCLGFHRAALFVHDRDRGVYVGSQAIGPRDAGEAHRIWEQIEEERKSIDAMIDDYGRHAVDAGLETFVHTLTLRPGPAPDDEVAAVEKTDGSVIPFRRARPVNEGIAALGPAEDFVLAAIRPHGEILGLIFVDDVFGGQAIDGERVRDLEFFVGQAGLVWENFTLLDRVASLAREDALTGLLNRREFETRFAAEASRARRSQGALGLLLVDVDHFKEINDSRGHQEGDQALRRVASVLQRTVRGHDTVARFGGDEFVVLLDGAPVAELGAAARRIGLLAREAGLSVSIGVAGWPEDCAETDELFSVADANLYRAKRAGRGRACTTGREPFGFDVGEEKP
jgi:diguanylate cyclase (GGDEF)-like protein